MGSRPNGTSMRRKVPVKTSCRDGLGLAILACLCLFLGGVGLARQKPNLLFIMTDQQRHDALSIAGNTVHDTPHLDRLARQGPYR